MPVTSLATCIWSYTHMVEEENRLSQLHCWTHTHKNSFISPFLSQQKQVTVFSRAHEALWRIEYILDHKIHLSDFYICALTCVNTLVHVCIATMWVQHPLSPEECVVSPGTGVTRHCELLSVGPGTWTLLSSILNLSSLFSLFHFFSK